MVSIEIDKLLDEAVVLFEDGVMEHVSVLGVGQAENILVSQSTLLVQLKQELDQIVAVSPHRLDERWLGLAAVVGEGQGLSQHLASSSLAVDVVVELQD